MPIQNLSSPFSFLALRLHSLCPAKKRFYVWLGAVMQTCNPSYLENRRVTSSRLSSNQIKRADRVRPCVQFPLLQKPNKTKNKQTKNPTQTKTNLSPQIICIYLSSLSKFNPFFVPWLLKDNLCIPNCNIKLDLFAGLSSVSLCGSLCPFLCKLVVFSFGAGQSP